MVNIKWSWKQWKFALQLLKLVCQNLSATILLSYTNFHEKTLTCSEDLSFFFLGRGRCTSCFKWELLKTPFSSFQQLGSPLFRKIQPRSKLVTWPIKCHCCPHIETCQLICCANQLTGFYMRAKLALNGLIWFLFCTRIWDFVEVKR